MDRTPDLTKLKGGPKHLWLKQHRAEILAYLDANGVARTLLKYHTTYAALEGLCATEGIKLPATVPGTLPADAAIEAAHAAIVEVDKLRTVVERGRQANADLRREVRELKTAFAMFQQSIAEQIAAAMVKAITQNLTVPDNMVQSGKNPLALEGEDGPRHISPRSFKRLSYAATISEPGSPEEIEDLLLEFD